MWKPTTSLKTLKVRAKLLEATRAFFKVRDVLEVETPILGTAPVTDPFLTALETTIQNFPDQTFYLQTSPEYYQKRLLAAYGISCYQLGKCFRDDEYGRLHSPEFTMLEWYQVGFDDHALMDEVEALLACLIAVLTKKHAIASHVKSWSSDKIKRMSYREVFQIYLQLDPHQVSLAVLQKAVQPYYTGIVDRDTALQLLMTEIIEKELAKLTQPVFIYDFPASQAALAQLKTLSDGTQVAARFELYWQGVELGNGYHELLDFNEQQQRFKADLAKRKALGLKTVPLDQNLLHSLAEGSMPACSGIAIGFDRLVMVLLAETALEKVQSFFKF